MSAAEAVLLTIAFAAMLAVGVAVIGWSVGFFREAIAVYRSDLF